MPKQTLLEDAYLINYSSNKQNFWFSVCNIEGDIGFLNLKKFLNANVPIHEFEQSLSNVEVFKKQHTTMSGSNF